MKELKEMDNLVKDFFNCIDRMLENDTDIEVNSVDDIVKMANEYKI